jgi:hypothetical protein
VTRITLDLPRPIEQGLRSLAWREHRYPKQQAIRLLEDGLRREGEMPAQAAGESESDRTVAGE